MIWTATGHRPEKLGGYDDAVFERLVLLASEALAIYKPDEVIVGMAQGWDQAVAQACIDLGIPFVAAIPFVGQQLKWPPKAQEYWQYLLEKSCRNIVVGGTGYAVWKMQARNRWMIDHAQRVLALWNGSDGGTANCIMYAGQKDVPVVNLWKRWEAMIDAPC